MTTKNELLEEYIFSLEKRRGTDYFGVNAADMDPREIADKMFKAIENGGKQDWIKYNEALKEACKNKGIKTSRELRELIKSN